jgi:hypothetical protein
MTRSGGRSAGVMLYCQPIFQHPFTGWEIVLVVNYSRG